MDRREMIKVLSLLSFDWPNFTVPNGDQGALVDAWLRLLGDLDASVVLAAVESLANENREFAPPPGVISKRARELSAPSIPDIDESLAEVLENVRAIGSNAYTLGQNSLKLRWSHPAIEDAVAAFSWQAICESENPDVLRGQWARFYGAARARYEREQAMPNSVKELLSMINLRADRTLEEGDQR